MMNQNYMRLVSSMNRTAGTPSFSNTKSVLFDGIDEYVDLGRVTMIESATTVSVSMWVKQTTFSGSRTFFGRHLSGNNNFYAYSTTVSGVIQFVITNGGGNYANVKTTASTTLNAWNHVCFVYDGGLTGNLNRAKIYINGVSSATSSAQTIPATLSSDTSSVFLGAINNAGTASSLYTGYEDEARFYDYSLTQTNVTDIYNSGVPKADDLSTLAVHKYRMGDGDTFPTLLDSGTTGGNNGTMTNMESGDINTDVP